MIKRFRIDARDRAFLCALSPIPRPWHTLLVRHLKTEGGEPAKVYLRPNQMRKLSELCKKYGVPAGPLLRVARETDHRQSTVVNGTSTAQPPEPSPDTRTEGEKTQGEDRFSVA